MIVLIGIAIIVLLLLVLKPVEQRQVSLKAVHSIHRPRRPTGRQRPPVPPVVRPSAGQQELRSSPEHEALTQGVGRVELEYVTSGAVGHTTDLRHDG